MLTGSPWETDHAELCLVLTEVLHRPDSNKRSAHGRYAAPAVPDHMAVAPPYSIHFWEFRIARKQGGLGSYVSFPVEKYSEHWIPAAPSV